MTLATGASNDGGTAQHLLVYPDPPLQPEEANFLEAAFPQLRLRCFTEWAATLSSGMPTSSDDRQPLRGLSVGLSISEAEDWASQGLMPEHQEDLTADLARVLIGLGACVVWGGDLRSEGLNKRLHHIVEAWHHAGRPPQDFIVSFLAAPIYEGMPEETLQKRRSFADVRLIERPAVQGIAANLSKPETSEQRAGWAVCLTHMRMEMAKCCHASILIGGKLNGYLGRCPGVVEEAVTMLTLGKPVFALGGFGGAARAVAQALTNSRTRAFDWDADLATASRGMPWNALSDADNKMLLETDDPWLIARALVRGLRALASGAVQRSGGV